MSKAGRNPKSCDFVGLDDECVPLKYREDARRARTRQEKYEDEEYDPRDRGAMDRAWGGR